MRRRPTSPKAPTEPALKLPELFVDSTPLTRDIVDVDQCRSETIQALNGLFPVETKDDDEIYAFDATCRELVDRDLIKASSKLRKEFSPHVPVGYFSSHLVLDLRS